MNDARTPDTSSATRRATVRRARRALVANYIHELSDRHGGGEPAPAAVADVERDRAITGGGSPDQL